MFEQQKQQAGDNSQQIQVEQLVINNGIDEKRAREIVDEKLHEIIPSYTQEARTVAESRINLFANDLIPKLVKGNLLEALKEPSIQTMLSEAQKSAASTEREADYALLSELLIQRVKKGTDRNVRAGISRAVEIVDKISDEALLGLTVAHSLAAFTPSTGSIENGVEVLAGLFEKTMYAPLPKGSVWLENLDVLDAIRVSSLGSLKKTDNFYAARLSGYVDIGIEKESGNYECALAVLRDASLPADILCDHALREGYVRLNIVNVDRLDSLTIRQYVQLDPSDKQKTFPVLLPLFEKQKQKIIEVYAMYKKDTRLRNENVARLMEIFENYESLKELRKWWDSLPMSFSITPVGRVLAQANAQRCDPSIPNID